MKKVTEILTFIFIVGMFFSACQKDEIAKTVEETAAPEIFFKENRLAFNTLASYDNTITNLSTPETIEHLEQTNESPLKTLKKSLNQNEELYDDFLLSILNEDKIVQIGQWIIKVDMENELVSVISEENIKLYEDLVDGADNENIYEFSTEDDVLDLLEAGVKGTIGNSFKIKWWQRCKERKVNGDVYYGKGSFGINNGVRYFRAGIYFSLYAKSKMTEELGVGLRVDIYGQYKFEDRCDRSYSRTWRTGYNAGMNNKKGDKVVLKVYEHRKTLRQYKLEAKIKITWPNGSIQESGLMSIVDGY